MKNLILGLLAMGSLLATQSPAQEKKSGPKSATTTANELIMRLQQRAMQDTNIKALSEDEEGLLTRLTLYQDRQYPDVYYYTVPLALGKKGPNAFTENVNEAAINAMNSIQTIIQGTLDQAAADKMLFGIRNNSHTNTAGRIEADNRPSTQDDIVKGAQSILDKDSDAQNRFVNAVRLAATSMGMISAHTIQTYPDALKAYAAVLVSAPVLDVTIPVAFGFDRKTRDAFVKLRTGLPEVKFYELNMDPIWRLRAHPYLSDRPATSKGPQSDLFLANLRTDTNLVLGLENLPIASTGGHLLLSFTYPGALRFGYGRANPEDHPLIKDSKLNLHYLLPGFLLQERDIGVQFRGHAVCRFKGQVLLNRQVTLSKVKGTIADRQVFDHAVNENQNPDINDCDVFDENGQVPNMEDPQIKKLVAAFKAKHIANNLKTYQAALSTKAQILAKSLANEAAFEALPMPKELREGSRRVVTQECMRKVTFLFFAEEKCTEVARWMKTYSMQPVEVVHFNDSASFMRIFDESEVFQINVADTVPKFPQQTQNLLCITRSAAGSGFDRSDCDAPSSNKAKLEQVLDMSVETDKPFINLSAESGI